MLVLFVIVCFDLIGFGLIVPIIPVFVHNYQLNSLQIGILVSSFLFAYFLGSIVLGYISDVFGRKKLLILVLIGVILSYLFTGFIQVFQHKFALIVLFRLLTGFFSSNMSIIFALASNLSNKENIVKNMSFLGGALTVGFIFGPTLGGWLSNNYDSITPFYYTAFFYLVCLLLVITFVKEPTYPVGETHSKIFKTLFDLLTNLNILVYLLFFVIVNFAFAGLEVFLLTQTLSINLHQSPLAIGLTWTYLAIILSIVQFTCYKLFKPQTSIIIGLFLFSFSVLGLIFAYNLTIVYILITVLAFGCGILFPHVSANLSLTGSAKQQGSIFGITGSAQAVGGVIGPFLLSAIYYVTNSIVYIWITIFILLCLSAIGITVFFSKKLDKQNIKL